MISIILPSYNHAPFLKRRIDSILEQTFQDFELIILDDKSPDNSQEIIEQYRSNKHVSHIIYNESNSGSTFYQWNKGISLAKGEYIWITESDDYADPTLLQSLYDNIKQKPNIVISYCESYKVDEKEDITGSWSTSTDLLDREQFKNDFVMDGSSFIQKYLIRLNAIPNASAVLFSKEAFNNTGGAVPNVGFAGDWLVWLKIAEQGQIAFTSQSLNYNRRHEKSVVTAAIAENTTSKNLFIKKYDLLMRVQYQQYLTKSKINKKILELNRESIVEDALIEGRYLWLHNRKKEGFRYIALAFRYSNHKIQLLRRIISAI